MKKKKSNFIFFIEVSEHEFFLGEGKRDKEIDIFFPRDATIKAKKNLSRDERRRTRRVASVFEFFQVY